MTLLGLGASILAACQRALGLTVEPTDIPNTPERSETPVPPDTSTPEPAASPTATEVACVELLTPEDGAMLAATGKVTFSWDPIPGAASYRLEVRLPTGQVVPFETKGVSRDQYLEAFRIAGEFQWRVLALDPTDNVICESDSFTFEKAQAPTRDKGAGGAGSGDTSGGPDGGPGSGTTGTGSSAGAT